MFRWFGVACCRRRCCSCKILPEMRFPLRADNSDLNLSIGKERFSAEPFSQLGFGLMWAGARATYGVLKGKVCYETKVRAVKPSRGKLGE